MDINTQIRYISIAIIPLIFAITLHEAAHGYIANKFGDKTALMLGRVTLNPIKHIDPIGTIIVPFLMLLFGGFVFGWAKPVPVNWQNLNNPRRDMALVALAGPLSNLLMAFFWAIITKISLTFAMGEPSTIRDMAVFVHAAGLFGMLINCVLLILNLLPLPPLDGSRVVSSFLPANLAILYEKIEPYGIWILLILILTRVLQFIILPPIFALLNFIKGLFGIA